MTSSPACFALLSRTVPSEPSASPPSGLAPAARPTRSARPGAIPGRIALILLAASTCLVATDPALAHGFAGKRFFPATIQTDDPFVADEGSLPTITWNPTAADGSHETDYGIDLAKRITPDFGVTFSEQ